jgi:hypothetical protein
MQISRRLALAACIAQCVGLAVLGWAQASVELQRRIPKADPRKYSSIRDASQWRNPYLVVHPDGVDVIGITSPGQTISVDSVPTMLEHLPNSAWPYGLIVAVQENGIVSPDEWIDHRQAKKLSRLVELLKKKGIAVSLWPSA